MPISVDSETGGVTVQTQDQILAETNSAFAAEFGPDFELSDDSFTYRQNALLANREASVQSGIATAFTSLDLEHATGVQLDFAGTLSSKPRQAATRSLIAVSIVGTPGTDVSDKRVKYLITGDLWRTPLGVTIGETGTVETELTAEETGPIFATPQATTAWAIVDVISGFTSVESLADAERGRDRETDPVYKSRLLNPTGSGGTEPRVRSELGTTPGVQTFEYDNNRTPVTNADGVPAWHAEAIVTGGSDLDVATTLYNFTSGGTGFHGNTKVDVTDPSDGSITVVQLSRILNRQVAGKFVFKRSGDTPLPVGAEGTAIAAIANRINTNGANIDVDPGDLIAVGALSLPPGTVLPDHIDTTGDVAFKGSAPLPNVLPISRSENAFTITLPQAATVTGTQAATFDLTTATTLVVAVDDGSLTVLSVIVDAYKVVSAATITELVASFAGQASAGMLIGSQGGALTITSSTTGLTSSVTIDASSTLLATLGFSAGVTQGSDPDIAVSFLLP